MINFINIDNSEPFMKLRSCYQEAFAANQNNIEAICLSSYNKMKEEVSSRYVNIKYIKDEDLVFFFKL